MSRISRRALHGPLGSGETARPATRLAATLPSSVGSTHLVLCYCRQEQKIVVSRPTPQTRRRVGVHAACSRAFDNHLGEPLRPGDVFCYMLHARDRCIAGGLEERPRRYAEYTWTHLYAMRAAGQRNVAQRRGVVCGCRLSSSHGGQGGFLA